MAFLISRASLAKKARVPKDVLNDSLLHLLEMFFRAERPSKKAGHSVNNEAEGLSKSTAVLGERELKNNMSCLKLWR